MTESAVARCARGCKQYRDEKNFVHTVSGTISRTIVIDGQNITRPGCGYMELTALDMSKNTGLKELDCSDNLLTSLDVTNNIALTELWCAGNLLTAEGLNALFGTLHGNSVPGRKIIMISGNPGADDCDKSIAIDKGWTMM